MKKNLNFSLLHGLCSCETDRRKQDLTKQWHGKEVSNRFNDRQTIPKVL